MYTGTPSSFGLICLILVDLVPEVAADGSNIGGLVAAAIISFFCLVAAVIMVLVALLWRDWYYRQQLNKGKRRIARRHSHMGFWRSRSQTSLTLTPESMRKIRMTSGPSRESTMNRQQLIRGDTWFTKVEAGKKFEEKVQTIELEPEEEDIVVAEIMPDQNNLRSTQHLRTTYTQQTTPTSYVITRLGEDETSFSRPNVTTTTTTDASGIHNMYYVPVTKDPSTSAASKMRQTTAPSRVSYEPYHVQSAHLSQTTRHQSDQSDIFITPLIPAASKSDSDGAAQMDFDSDDEAGNVPKPQVREDDVLF